MIDDNPDVARELSLADIRVLLFDQPWNRKLELSMNIERVRSWGEVIEKLNPLRWS